MVSFEAPIRLVSDLSGAYRWDTCMFLEFRVYIQGGVMRFRAARIPQNNVSHTDERNE